MKKFIILSLLFAISITTSAQHKPLKQIKLPDIYISNTGAEKTYNTENTREIYSAYFYTLRNSIAHHKGIRDYDLGYDAWVLNVGLDTDEAIALNSHALMNENISDFFTGVDKLKISVGESIYTIDCWYYSSMNRYYRLMLDINKFIAKHISISGLQGIISDDIEIIAFSEIEQELWRRAANDVYETRKNL